MWKGCVFIVLFILLASFVTALSDQGTGVVDKITGNPINGNLTVQIYDSLIGGSLVYQETFLNAIVNGSWNVMLGENVPLSLNYGNIYYKDYLINGENANFVNGTGAQVGRRFFISPIGQIGGQDIDNTTNLTVNKLTLGLGSMIENVIMGWLKINNLNVTGNLLVGGKSVCLSDGTNCPGGSGQNASIYYNKTSATYNGNIGSYDAANAACASEFTGSHFCTTEELLQTMIQRNVSLITEWTGTAWIQGGPPGYTANANDCKGWTSSSNVVLGKFWDFDDTTANGMGWMTNCANTKSLACCR